MTVAAWVGAAGKYAAGMLTQVRATRYVTPLREGGSLPGIVEADDDGMYVVKFSGAGQGLKVLVAEVIVAGLAMRLGIRVPRLVAIEMPEAIARYEAGEEVQDVLSAARGGPRCGFPAGGAGIRRVWLAGPTDTRDHDPPHINPNA